MRGFGIGGLRAAALSGVSQLMGGFDFMFNRTLSTARQDAVISQGRSSGRWQTPAGSWNRTTWHLGNGRRERERRCRQIAAGQLKRENGLVE